MYTYSFIQDNVLIDEVGDARITDFGLSYVLSPSTMWKTSKTSPGGSLRWMSPELLKADEPRATLQSDVYAFAMTIIVRYRYYLPSVLTVANSLLGNPNRRSSLCKTISTE